MSEGRLFTYVVLHPPPIHTWRAGWWGGSDGIWAGSLRLSHCNRCGFCCCHSLCHSDCLLKLWTCSLSALNHLCVDDERCRISLIGGGSKVQIKHIELITCTPPVAAWLVTRDGQIGAGWGWVRTDAKEAIGNIVMTPWKMIHKHPDIRLLDFSHWPHLAMGWIHSYSLATPA